MFRRTIQCVVFSGAIALPALSFAQPPGRGGQQRGMHGGPPVEMLLHLFQQADADHDGNVTKAELTAAIESQSPPRGNRFGRGGMPPHDRSQNGGLHNRRPGGQLGRPEGPPPEGPPPRNGGESGPQGPPVHGHHAAPQPGQIVPEPMLEALSLDDDQQQQLQELQATVHQRLASILTDEQMEKFKNHRPPHGPGHPTADGDRSRPAGGKQGRAGLPRRPERQID